VSTAAALRTIARWISVSISGTRPRLEPVLQTQARDIALILSDIIRTQLPPGFVGVYEAVYEKRNVRMRRRLLRRRPLASHVAT